MLSNSQVDPAPVDRLRGSMELRPPWRCWVLVLFVRML